MKRINVSLLLVAIVSTTLLHSSFVSASTAPSSDEGLEECLSKNSSLAVLMLIDESKSLREFKDGGSVKLGNDPFDSRVPALESVVRVLASAVESSSLLAGDARRPLDVAIGISGFGDGYSERVPFERLNGRSVEQIVSGLEQQRERDSDLHTRYHTALQGALTSFEKYSTSPDVCRLLVWFSDGEHDDDNSPGFISRERDQIQNLMCGDGGIVDTLRLAKVNIVAAGLNPDEGKLALMRLIAEGGSPYRASDSSGKEGRVNVSVDKCGAEPTNGRYAVAASADDIVDRLFEVLETVPGIPNPNDSVEIPTSQIEECKTVTPSEPEVCNALEFEVDETVVSFQILAERPTTAVEVILTTNEGQSYSVLKTEDVDDSNAKDEELRKNTVSTTPVTKRKVFVSVTRKKENPIAGSWRLDFLGAGATESRGTVNFVGATDIQIESPNFDSSRNSLKVARFKAENLGIRVRTETPGTAVRDLLVSFRSFEGVETLAVQRDETDDALFSVAGGELERALQGQKLKKASSTDLFVQPVGDVQGLRFKDGRPVPINYGYSKFGVRVSNGAGLPSFVRSEGGLAFQGTPKQKVSLVFLGPDSGDGLVEFKEAIEPNDAKANLDLIPRDACVIPQQEEAVCEIELIPDSEAFDQFPVSIAVIYSGKDTVQEPVEGEVTVEVDMVRQPNAGRGVIAAVYLILGFLVVQGLVRWLLAFLLSRFAPLVPIARRVRLDAVVDSAGSISVNPMNVAPSHNDEGFALENTDSVQTFTIFGYEFSVSVLKTFLRSTVAPVGQVDSPSKYVIGSRGYTKSKDQVDSTTGQVSLTLRGQWVVGVSSADIQRLLNGESTVPAEVVAFLEPYEQGPDREQQISDLSFGLVSSSFAAQFMEILGAEREKVSAGEETPSESGGSSTGFDDVFGDTSVSATSDPFESLTSAPKPKESPKDSRKKRRGRHSPDTTESSAPVEESKSSDEWDPFA